MAHEYNPLSDVRSHIIAVSETMAGWQFGILFALAAVYEGVTAAKTQDITRLRNATVLASLSLASAQIAEHGWRQLEDPTNDGVIPTD